MRMRVHYTSAIAGHRLREIHKADRLNFKIVPNRYKATDFYQIKIELYKQIRYGTNVTGFFGGGIQVIDMSAQFLGADAFL